MSSVCTMMSLNVIHKWWKEPKRANFNGLVYWYQSGDNIISESMMFEMWYQLSYFL